MTILRRLRRMLAGTGSPGSPKGSTAQFIRTQTLIRGFYAFLLYLAALNVPDFAGLSRSRELELLWPVAWVDGVGQEVGLKLILAWFLASAVAGAFAPASRAVRLAVFLGLLEFVALRNSEGKIGHSLHLAVLAALALVFLPAGWLRPEASRVTRTSTLVVFSATQALLLLTYTMSGLAKLGGGMYELFSGQANPWQPDGFARVIAERLLETGSTSLVGGWMIDHPWLSGPLLPAVIYLQTMAFVAAFRPALHRGWGLSLILFHLGNSFILTIHFPQSMALLALFFLASPFAPDRLDGRAILLDLPLVGLLRRIIPGLRNVPPVPQNFVRGSGSAS